MTTLLMTFRQQIARADAAHLTDQTSGLHRQLRCYLARARQRRQLAALSREQLKDIGISACEAKREAAKYFWQE